MLRLLNHLCILIDSSSIIQAHCLVTHPITHPKPVKELANKTHGMTRKKHET